LLINIGVLILHSCDSQPRPGTGIPATSVQKQPVTDCSIALKFINDYAEFCTPKSPPVSDSDWVGRNPLLTDNFKSAHKKMVDDAFRHDPELGLESDPIFDAQDFPDKGFELVNCDTGTGYVTVRGKDWPAFVLVLKVARQGGKWLVDGAGEVNIPVERRRKR